MTAGTVWSSNINRLVPKEHPKETHFGWSNKYIDGFMESFMVNRYKAIQESCRWH